MKLTFPFLVIDDIKLTGIAETSGLKIEEAVIMDNWLSLVLLGRRAGCSSFVAWGSETTDGTAYMGRNLDFPEFSRDQFAANGVITVMNPVGGDFGLAGVGIAGTISGFDDMMNSEGLYAGFNNGAGSIEPGMYSNRFPLPSFISTARLINSESSSIPRSPTTLP